MSKQRFFVGNEIKLKMVKLTSNGDAKFAYKIQEMFGADIFGVLNDNVDICKFISGAAKGHFLDDPINIIKKIEKMYSESEIQNDQFVRIILGIKKYAIAKKKSGITDAELVKNIENQLFDVLTK